MRRFWKSAAAVERDGGWGIRLDDKLLRTPARELLIVPTQALAQAIAEEWARVADKVDPREMPLTGLAKRALPGVKTLALKTPDDLDAARELIAEHAA